MTVHYHPCTACTVLPTLDLKFVLHHGGFVLQSIAGQEKLLGPDVNVGHRLLKNSVTEVTGKRAYLFATDAAATYLKLDPDRGLAHEERYGDVGPVAGMVVDVLVAGPGMGSGRDWRGETAALPIGSRPLTSTSSTPPSSWRRSTAAV